MVRARLAVGIACVALFGLCGCGSGGKTTEVQAKLPEGRGLEQAKAILNEYAQGGAMGSEAMNFPDIVEDVKKSDPKKAAILEKGFADLQKTPATSRERKAKELLKQL